MAKDEEMLLVGIGGVAMTLILIWLLNNNVSVSPVTTDQASAPALATPDISPSSFSPGSFTINNNPASADLAPFIPTAQGASIPPSLVAFLAPIFGSSNSPVSIMTNVSPNPSITSSDGGVSPPCGCSTPSDATYYGSPGDQASVLSNQVFSALNAIKSPFALPANTPVANAIASEAGGNYIQPPVGGTFGSFIANVVNSLGS